MATSAEEAIMESLFGRLATLVLSPAHPVSWPNLNFTRPTNNRFLEARYVPNTTTRFFIGSQEPHQRLGFLQVNVRDALNQGSRVVGIAGLVAAHFPADLKLPHTFGLTVRIISAADTGDPIIETTPPGVLVPVLIPFECWA